MSRRICVVTTTRAEYGLLKPILRQLDQASDVELQLVVSGTHLLEEHGHTVKEIELDGFDITRKVPLPLLIKNRIEMSKAVAAAILAFTDVFNELRPDLLVILGDRYEILGIAQAGFYLGIPIAHLHGGEVTEGAIDDSIRHALTKLSSLHFTSTDTYRQRVIQLGEEPDRVFNTGAPGLDNLRELHLPTRDALEKELDIRLGPISFLITYHPETQSMRDPTEDLKQLLIALERWPNASLILTAPNADPGGRDLDSMCREFCHRHMARAKFVQSLGTRLYISVMKHVTAVVGNSSSGIIEAPFFGIPTVNIGDRQNGRLRAASIIDCGPSAEEINQALHKAVSLTEQEGGCQPSTLFGDGHSAKRIAQILREIDLKRLSRKRFYDLIPSQYH